jgi:hypothetical protein
VAITSLIIKIAKLATFDGSLMTACMITAENVVCESLNLVMNDDLQCHQELGEEQEGLQGF